MTVVPLAVPTLIGSGIYLCTSIVSIIGFKDGGVWVYDGEK